MKKLKPSYHAKERVNQRLNIAYKGERNKLFKRAMRYGHPISDFAGEFERYLKCRKRSSTTGVKVYDNNIFIYSRNIVITVFPVPEKYLPIKEHFASYIKNNPYLLKLYDEVDKDEIVLDIIVKDKDSVTAGLYVGDFFENFGVGKTELKAKNNAIKSYLKRIGKLEDGEEHE